MSCIIDDGGGVRNDVIMLGASQLPDVEHSC